MRKKITLEICEELLEQADQLKLNLSELLETSIRARRTDTTISTRPSTDTTTSTKPSTEPTSITSYINRDVKETTMDVELTDVGKRWLQDHYPQGIVWEYDVDKPFKLQGWAAEFIELTCRGLPYRIPPDIDGQPTIRRAVASARARDK